MFWIILSIFLIIIIYYKLLKPHRYWKDRGVKQSKPFFLFGDMFYKCIKRQSFGGYVQYIYNMIPGTRYSGFYQFLMPSLMIKDPELVKQITVKDFDSFADHSQFVPEDIDPLWAKNLFSLTGKRWKDMRATLSPCFTGNKMKYMFGLMLEASESFLSNLESQNKDVIEVEFTDIFSRVTNDIIATTAFGIKTDSLSDRNNKFYIMARKSTDFSGIDTILKFFGFVTMPKIMKLFGIKVFSKSVTDFFSSLIKDTVETRRAKSIIRPDMIHILMESHKSKNNESVTVEKPCLTHEDITAQALVFYFAGFEPVSALMCLISYELGVNQEIQDRLRKEVNDTLKECNGNLTYDALMNMKYLDMVFSETLRKWPTAVTVDRICTKPYTIKPVKPDEKPLHLDLNTVVWIPYFGIHRDPDNFPDPDRFDPERFNEENKDKIKPYTYIPFGSGPRKCIGARYATLETKLIIFQVLTKFKIVPTDKTVIPVKLCKKTFNMTAEGGYWFGFKRI